MGGAEPQFLHFCFFFFGECDSSGVSGHRLNPQITTMTASTTRLNDTIHRLWVVSVFSRDRGPERAPLPQDCAGKVPERTGQRPCKGGGQAPGGLQKGRVKGSRSVSSRRRVPLLPFPTPLPRC